MHVSPLLLSDFEKQNFSLPCVGYWHLFRCVQIRDKLSIIQSGHRDLLNLYQQRLEEFEHNLDAQVFDRDAEQAEAWISNREAFLGSEEDELGVSVFCCCCFY